jgi:hypothetical protein
MLQAKEMRYKLIILFLISATAIMAQHNEQVTVVAPYQPILTEMATKLNGRPTTIDTTFAPKEMNYDILSRKVLMSFDIETIKPATISGEPLQKLYPFKARLGFGMYYTPLLEIYAGNLRSEKFHYGGYIRHLSSWGEIKVNNNTPYNHSNMTNEAKVFGGYFTDKVRMNLDIAFNNNLYHLPNNMVRPRIFGADDRGQRILNDLTANYVIRNNSAYKSNISYKVNLKFNFNEFYKMSRELSAGFNFDIGGNPGFGGVFEDSKFSANASADIFAINNIVAGDTNADKDALAYQFEITPKYTLSYGDGSYELGLKINTHSDFDYNDLVTPVFTAVTWIPYASVNYKIIPNILHIEAGADGSVNQNSQKIISLLNPLVLDLEHPLGHFVYRPATTRNYFIGLYTAIFKDLSFSVKGSFVQYKNLVSYSEDLRYLQTPEYFTANSAKVEGNFKYVFKNHLQIDLTGFLNYYDRKVTYLPLLEAKLDIRYNWKEKLVLKTQIYAYTGMLKSTEDETIDGQYDVPGAVDWNFEAEYRITRQWAVFARCGNLLNSRYYRWDGRPSYRFQVIGGVAFNL